MLQRLSRILDRIIGPVALLAFLILLLEHTAALRPLAPWLRRVNLGILGLFLATVITTFLASEDKRRHLRRHWMDLIVFVPLLQFAWVGTGSPWSAFGRQLVIVAMLTSRARRAYRFLSLLLAKPAQLMLITFVLAIGTGAILLQLPAATANGVPLSFVDALFTSASATCVTGLIVVDTATRFSLFGQSVILALIQLGGLGIMTFSVAVLVLLRRSLAMKQEAVLQDILDQEALSSARSLLVFLAAMTFAVEAVGAAGLFLAWRTAVPDPVARAGHAAFHAVSAFCNAGFSTFSDSLVRFAADGPTNLWIGALIVAGGLGFAAVQDVVQCARGRCRVGGDRTHRFRIQTKIVLTVTVLLILGGGILIGLSERKGVLASLPLRGKLWVSLFQSVTTRTAGFNTCDIAALAPGTLLVMIILMFIGASPGSTGGGIKTTTAAVLWASVISGLQERPHVQLWKRTISLGTLQKAMTVFLLSIIVVLGGTLALLAAENKPFLDIAFETVSAFATVGLSTGVTPALSAAGKLVVTALMLAGRLGPLTLAYAFAARRRAGGHYAYAEERVMIG